MQTRILSLSVIVALAVWPANASAQSVDGFAIGAHVNGSAWSIDDLETDTESGGGGGVVLFYGFSDLIGAFINIDAASITPDDGESYTLAHADLGAQFTFGGSKIRPYLLAAFSGRAADFPTAVGDLELSGGALSAGGGLYYFLSDGLALDVNLVFSRGEFTDVALAGQTGEVELDATSSRLNFGVRWYPNRQLVAGR